MKYLIPLCLLFSISFGILAMPAVFSQSGVGIQCPITSGPHYYVDGSAYSEVTPFDVGELGVLFCNYTLVPDNDFALSSGSLTALYHFGEVSQELFDEYGCGEILGIELSPIYISSATHFAVVAFTTDGLTDAANEILTQIEEQNLATICTDNSANQEKIEKIRESTKDVVEKMNEPVLEPEDLEELTVAYDEEGFITGLVQVAIIPDWIKNNAGWWATGEITEEDFVLGIEFLITEGFILLPPTEIDSETSDVIPDWVKNNAGWWAEDLISDNEFINGLQFLISKGIISVTFS